MNCRGRLNSTKRIEIVVGRPREIGQIALGARASANKRSPKSDRNGEIIFTVHDQQRRGDTPSYAHRNGTDPANSKRTGTIRKCEAATVRQRCIGSFQDQLRKPVVSAADGDSNPGAE